MIKLEKKLDEFMNKMIIYNTKHEKDTLEILSKLDSICNKDWETLKEDPLKMPEGIIED